MQLLIRMSLKGLIDQAPSLTQTNEFSFQYTVHFRAQDVRKPRSLRPQHLRHFHFVDGCVC